MFASGIYGYFFDSGLKCSVGGRISYVPDTGEAVLDELEYYLSAKMNLAIVKELTSLHCKWRSAETQVAESLYIMIKLQ